MMFKKIALALGCLMTLTAVMAGCGTASTSSTSTASKAASSKATTSEAATSSATTSAGELPTKLIMATNAAFEPYEFYESDKIVGIDAEVGAAIAEKLGMEFEIADMDFDSIIPALQSGKASMGMAGMTVTPDREKNVSFTQSYATGVQVVIVPEGSTIASIEDMEGKKIGVQQGTTGDIYCSDTPEKGGFGEENITRFNKGSEAIIALTAGKIDCVVIDNEPAKAFVAANEGLSILETAYTEEDYAIAVAKENTALKDAIDKALGELIADGTVKSIVDKYITTK